MNHRQTASRTIPLATIITSFSLLIAVAELSAQTTTADQGKKKVTTKSVAHDAMHDCHYQSFEKWQLAIESAVRLGEIPDPTTRRFPPIAPRVQLQGGPVCTPTPVAADLFQFEDTAGLLLTNFSNGALFGLMTDAGNALLAAEGDNFDFIAFWVNFTPDHTLGTAFYLGLENDVSGIGSSLFNGRPSMGLGGNNVEGYVMMWNINSSFWATGSGSNATFTRLVLGQEFEHRFGMFLPNLLDGRRLQGNDGACGRGAHWNFKVDGQGSGMEIAEWIGASPATRQNGSLNFNTDIGATDAVFSYTDLYLMGYVSPAEMDAGNSELRYLNNNTNCSSPYNGTITNFTAADIAASAGVRTPTSDTAQKDFRTAWIMIHQPGDAPSPIELNKAAGILEQWSIDWKFSTLDRGTMNNTLRASCLPGLEWQPASANVPNSIAGNSIVVPSGGAQITLDLLASSWTPNLVSVVSGTVDSAGYTSGGAGTLSPVVTPDVTAGAFVDTARPDYIFAGAASATSVQTSSLDYNWVSSVNVAGNSAVDTGGARYAGSLVLDVSPDAEGTFTVGLLQPSTFLTDDAGVSLGLLNLTPATITVAPGNTSCIAPEQIVCDTTIVIDNSAVSGAPNPSYACGFGSTHDGTLWYQFTATDASARLTSCDSVAQDSTFAVYEGTCGALVPIGCSEDDDCGTNGFLGDLNVTGLTIGETYIVQFSAWQPSDRGQYTLGLGCSVMQASSPVPDTTTPDTGNGTRNRYLSFSGGDPGRLQAVRVTYLTLPPPFDVLNGQAMWVGAPTEESENSGILLPADAPGFPTAQFASLGCDPVSADWSTFGVINVAHSSIIPGATYSVQLVDIANVGNNTAFSFPLTITTSAWGDVAQSCATSPCSPPDGSIDLTSDIVSIISKFANRAGAPAKSRADLAPSPPDRLIDIGDVTSAISGFSGMPFPFTTVPDPCPGN